MNGLVGFRAEDKPGSRPAGVMGSRYLMTEDELLTILQKVFYSVWEGFELDRIDFFQHSKTET